MKARSIEECKRACPGLVVRGMRPQRYREVGRAVHEMLKSVVGPTVPVEKASCDDFYLDITSLCSSDEFLNRNKELFGFIYTSSRLVDTPPEGLKFISSEEKEEDENLAKIWSTLSSDLQRGIWIAHALRQILSQKLGLTASCAVSRNKLISRLASPVNKPNGLTLVASEAAAIHFIGSIPINRIPSMQGKFGAEVQESLKIELVKDLVNFEKKDLASKFGDARGTFLFDLPRALDPTPVAERGPPKSITSERRFPPAKNQEIVANLLKNLIEQLLLRGAEDFAEHSRLPIKLGIGFRLGYNTNLVSRSGPVPLKLLNWLRSSVNSESFCDGAAEAIDVATTAVMNLLRGATISSGRWDITRAAVVLHYSDSGGTTTGTGSRPENQQQQIGELFAKEKSGEKAVAVAIETSKKKIESESVAGPSKIGKKNVNINSTYRNAEALALQAMFGGGGGNKNSSGGGGDGDQINLLPFSKSEDDADKASLELALRLQKEEAEAMAASNRMNQSGNQKKKKRGPLDSFIVQKPKKT
jgi:nucleotidyltransferase/DNA polymerase involved in DNA repair